MMEEYVKICPHCDGEDTGFLKIDEQPTEVAPESSEDKNTATEGVSLTEFQKKAVEYAKPYQNMRMPGKIEVIAKTFGCKTGEIRTSPCRGDWRGTSDISLYFENGTSIFLGNRLTPKARTKKVQNEFLDSALVRYNPEIIKACKEAALPALIKRQKIDNEIAAQKGLRPYMILNVEFCDGADGMAYGGWYYVTFALDGKIFTHIETGLHYAIMNGEDMYIKKRYYVADGLKNTDVDYVFHNVGFSARSSLYSLPISKAAYLRAKNTLELKQRGILMMEEKANDE